MSGLLDLEINGLRLELATRRMRGPLVAGSPPRRWPGWAAAIPATLLTVALLGVPMVWTVAIAVPARPWLVAGCALLTGGAVGLTAILRRRADRRRGDRAGSTRAARAELLLLPIALACLVIGGYLLVGALTTDGLWAYLRTLAWVVVGICLLAVALLIAWWGRAARWLWRPLIVPFGISVFVSGVAFRLIFQFFGDLFGIESIVGYRIWLGLMLASAFVWTWLGFLTGVFRDAISAIEADPMRSSYLRQANGRWAHMYRLSVLQRPVVLILGLTVGVAAARVFDVVLIGVPGSIQAHVDSATVHWWRLATDTELGPGVAAAYSLPLAVLVGFVAWLLQTDIRRHRTSWSAAPLPAPDRLDARARLSKPRALAIALVSLLALIPLGWLMYAALDGPDGFGLTAFTRLWRDQALLRSLQTTAWVATLVTIVVLAAALPVAYRLAALGPNRMLARIAVLALVVLTVLPVQSYLGPLDALIATYGLSGTRIPLILVHAAAGLPIAILMLRGALLAPQDSPAADALHGLASPGAVARRVLDTAGPALGAVAVLEFIQVWNDFIVGLMISGAGASPWSLLLWGEARQFTENSAQVAAGALLSALLPVALLLATWRRWLIPGLTGRALR